MAKKKGKKGGEGGGSKAAAAVSRGTENGNGADQPIPEAEETEQETYCKLRACLQKEDVDYKAAIVICNKLLSRQPLDVDALRVKCQCLVHLHQYQEAYELVSSGAAKSIRDHFTQERAYCLFKLNKQVDAQRVLEEAVAAGTKGGGGGGAAALHVEAQVQYRLGQYEKAAQLYENVLDGGGGGGGGNDNDIELVNYYAASVAAGKAGYCITTYPVEESVQEEKELEEDDDAALGSGLGSGLGYELMYNVGCAYLQINNLSNASAYLEKAERVCKESLEEEGLSAEAVKDELAIIHTQMAYVLQQQAASGGGGGGGAAGGGGSADGGGGGGGSSGDGQDYNTRALKRYKEALKAKHADPAVVAVATNNMATLHKSKDKEAVADAAKRIKTLLESVTLQKKLTPAQLEALRFNRCLLVLSAGRFADCAELLTSLRREYPHSCQPALIEAAMLVKQGKQEEADKCLVQASSLNTASKDAVLRLKLARVQLALLGGKRDKAVELLTQIEEVRGYPGTTETVTALLKLTGRANEAKEVLCRSIEGLRDLQGLTVEAAASATMKMADRLRKDGYYREAADAYGKILDYGELLPSHMRLAAVACLVVSASYFDGERARQAAEEDLPYDVLFDDESGEQCDGEQLERTELPRSGRAKRLLLVDKAAQKSERKAASKNPEKQKKRREQRREKYIKAMIEKGKIDPSKPIPVPDPERWIPKKQRSYAKRGRKNRNKFVGAQGTGDGAAKDSAKLDVAARVASKKAEAEAAALKEAEEAKLASIMMGGGKKGKKKGRR